MKDFSRIRFKWIFSDYQKAVLDNSRNHFKDKRLRLTVKGLKT